MLLPQEETLDHITPDLRPLAWNLDELIPDPENANTHDARNIAAISESFVLYGQRTPFTVNRKTNYIEKGNGGYMAAKMLGWRKVAVVWTDDDRLTSLAYGVVDNRTSAMSRPNYAQTGAHLRELQAANYPMMKFWSNEEAMPLLRGEFQPAEITDENFDPGLQKGRAINKISASERLRFDAIAKFIRIQNKKPLTDGAVVEILCTEYAKTHLNEIEKSMVMVSEDEMPHQTEQQSAALSLDEE